MAVRNPLVSQPFALTGDRVLPPVDAQPDGKVSFNAGWGPDYQANPDTDPNAKPVERDITNALFWMLTSNLQQYQREGVPEFIAAADNGGVPVQYAVGTMVQWRTTTGDPFKVYLNTVNNNTAVPPAASWLDLSAVVAGALQRTGGTMTGALVLAGVSTAPTAATATNTTQIANTAYVKANAALLLPLTGGTMTGPVVLAGVSTAPTAAAGTNTLQIANTAHVKAASDALDNSKLSKSGGVMTGAVTLAGVSTAPTAAVGTNTLQVATTEFVKLAIAEIGFGTTATAPSIANLDDVTVASGMYYVNSGTTGSPVGANTGTVIHRIGGSGTIGFQIYTALNSNRMFWRRRATSVWQPWMEIAALNAAQTWTGLQTFSGGVGGLAKSDVGLDAVDNTSDADKPISTLTQAALNLKAPLASPLFTGTPAAPTAALGVATTQLATTAFVKNASGNYATFETVASARTLTSANLGRLITMAGTTAYAMTLPLASTCPAGSAITLVSINTSTVTATRQGTDTIGVSSTPVTTIAMGNGEHLVLVSNGTNAWQAIGSAQLPYCNSFGSLKANAGWQRLPGGLLLQWNKITTATVANTTYQFPIAFPTGVLALTSSVVNGTSPRYMSTSAPTLTGFVANFDTLPCDFSFFAIGH